MPGVVLSCQSCVFAGRSATAPADVAMHWPDGTYESPAPAADEDEDDWISFEIFRGPAGGATVNCSAGVTSARHSLQGALLSSDKPCLPSARHAF